MKKLRVFGHAEVTVSTEVTVANDATEQDIYDAAHKTCGGIYAFCGNGGMDKLIGVYGANNSIAADEEVVFDDFMPIP